MQVGLAAEDGLVEAAGHEFVVVDLTVVVHVDGFQQFLDIGQWNLADPLVLEVLPELLIRQVAVSIVVDTLEDLPHFLHLIA